MTLIRKHCSNICDISIPYWLVKNFNYAKRKREILQVFLHISMIRHSLSLIKFLNESRIYLLIFGPLNFLRKVSSFLCSTFLLLFEHAKLSLSFLFCILHSHKDAIGFCISRKKLEFWHRLQNVEIGVSSICYQRLR